MALWHHFSGRMEATEQPENSTFLVHPVQSNPSGLRENMCLLRESRCLTATARKKEKSIPSFLLHAFIAQLTVMTMMLHDEKPLHPFCSFCAFRSEAMNVGFAGSDGKCSPSRDVHAIQTMRKHANERCAATVRLT